MGRIFVCGDLHGDAWNVQEVMYEVEKGYTWDINTGGWKSQKDEPEISEDDIIIVCGDAGFEYGRHTSEKAKMAAACFPGKWIVLRGNHDSRYWANHVYKNDLDWEVDSDNDLLYEKKYPNIFYTKDEGGVYKFNGKRFLFVPGAYSVDKEYRQFYDWPYVEAEQLTFIEWDKLFSSVIWMNNAGVPIDYVIAHTFPRKLEPQYSELFLKSINQDSVDTTTEDRLDELCKLIERNEGFKHYFGGHFHGDMRMGKYTMLFEHVAEIIEED